MFVWIFAGFTSLKKHKTRHEDNGCNEHFTDPAGNRQKGNSVFKTLKPLKQYLVLLFYHYFFFMSCLQTLQIIWINLNQTQMKKEVGFSETAQLGKIKTSGKCLTCKSCSLLWPLRPGGRWAGESCRGSSAGGEYKPAGKRWGWRSWWTAWPHQTAPGPGPSTCTGGNIQRKLTVWIWLQVVIL